MYVCMYVWNGWMDGWMDGLMCGWMCGWMDVWMDGCVCGWRDGCVCGWRDGWMCVWMDGWMCVWMDGWMDVWMDGWMHACMYVCMLVLMYIHIHTWKFFVIWDFNQNKAKVDPRAYEPLGSSLTKHGDQTNTSVLCVYFSQRVVISYSAQWRVFYNDMPEALVMKGLPGIDKGWGPQGGFTHTQRPYIREILHSALNL